jgi:SAM-dependent methyltransferase
VEDFAGRNELDVEILKAMCNSLYALSILDRDGTDFVLDTKGKLLVEVARGWYDGLYGYEELYHSLEQMLRKEKVYGKDFYRKSHFVARGSGEVEAWLYFPLAIDVIQRYGCRKVLDLGCGDATFLRHLCTHCDVEGYGIDLAPEAIGEAERTVAEAGLKDRIHLAVADVTKLAGTPAGFHDVDIATMFFVLHEIRWHGREPVIEVLRGFRTIFPNVPLVVFEAIRPADEEMRRRPGMMVQYLLQHELSHQKLIHILEWREIFRAAGYSRVDQRYLSFARTAIFTLSG